MGVVWESGGWVWSTSEWGLSGGSWAGLSYSGGGSGGAWGESWGGLVLWGAFPSQEDWDFLILSLGGREGEVCYGERNACTICLQCAE